jgi:hypothetical protein
VWKNEEVEFLRKNWNKMRDIELVEALTETFRRKFTLHGVRKKRARIGIEKEKGRPNNGGKTKSTGRRNKVAERTYECSGKAVRRGTDAGG